MQIDRTKKMPRNQLLSGFAGIFTVGVVDLAVDSIHLTGPGLEGALRAGFWFGLIGGGGGLAAYAIVQRIKRQNSSK